MMLYSTALALPVLLNHIFQSSYCDYSRRLGLAWCFCSFHIQPRDTEVQERIQDPRNLVSKYTSAHGKYSVYGIVYCYGSWKLCAAGSSPETAGSGRRHKMLSHRFAKHCSKRSAVFLVSFLLNISSLWHPATFVTTDYNFSLMKNFGQTVPSHGRE